MYKSCIGYYQKKVKAHGVTCYKVFEFVWLRVYAIESPRLFVLPHVWIACANQSTGLHQLFVRIYIKRHV
jgi:hypothetical protein